MSDAVEQSCCHLGIPEHGRPLAEGEVGRDDDAGAFAELADQVEQLLPARARERQISKLIEHRRESCPAWVPPLPIRVSSSRRVTSLMRFCHSKSRAPPLTLITRAYSAALSTGVQFMGPNENGTYNRSSIGFGG